jgi:hypothetical protein
MRAPHHRALIAVTALAAVALTACRSSPTAGSGLPPPPPTPRQSLGANEPPVIWVGGTMKDVTPDHVRMQEGSGSVVTLQRLAQGATRFFHLSGGSWTELDPGAFVSAGQPACVETLMDRTNLLAIRVFLGSGCGPI